MDWSDQAAWQDFATRLAAAADLCLKPHRHGVKLVGELPKPRPAMAISACGSSPAARKASGWSRPISSWSSTAAAATSTSPW
jgi:hypothetical protein